MEHSLTDAEETVNAVLEEVLDNAQHWRSPGQDEDQDLILSADYGEQRMQTQLQDSRKVTTDQAVIAPADSSGTNGSDTVTATATLSQIAPVLSAMNPLFQPAQVVRPQSAQLQHTLSSMKRQLSALENSMQQPPGLLPCAACVLLPQLCHLHPTLPHICLAHDNCTLTCQVTTPMVTSMGTASCRFEQHSACASAVFSASITISIDSYHNSLPSRHMYFCRH